MQVPHLNQLQERYQERGLTIVGVTSEGKGKTESWVKSKGASYPYAYDEGGRLQRFFGVRGIPHAVLVDPGGSVVWRGHPGQLSEETIEAALDGALTFPVHEWPASAAKVRAHVASGDLAKALGASSGLTGESASRIADAVRVMIRGRVTAVRRALESGDYLNAQLAAERAKRSLEGLEEAAQVAEMLQRIEGDERAMAILKGQKELVVLIDEQDKLASRSMAIGLMEKLESLRDRHPGTIVARGADNVIANIRRNMRRLR